MLSGTAPVDDLMTHAATMAGFDTAACALPGTQVLQLMFETAVSGRQTSLPAGLHPTNPPSMVVQAWHCPESEWGAFSLASARVQCRSGLRPRGFVQGCVVDNGAAAAELGARWGFPAQVGEVTLDVGYHDTHLSVAIDGTSVLEVRALDPLPLGNDDIAFSGTLTLAHTPRGPRLVQVDTDMVCDRAERLIATMPTIDAAALGLHPSVAVTHPVSASLSRKPITKHCSSNCSPTPPSPTAPRCPAGRRRRRSTKTPTHGFSRACAGCWTISRPATCSRPISRVAGVHVSMRRWIRRRCTRGCASTTRHRSPACSRVTAGPSPARRPCA